MEPVNYFGMDKKRQTVAHGRVSENQAVFALQERFRDLKPFYETEDDALAATFFGFRRGDDNFIEISIHARDHIDFTYEATSTRKFFFMRFRSRKICKVKITSPLMVERLVMAYFGGDHDELVGMLA